MASGRWYLTLDNPKDPAFNELFSINDHDTLAGTWGLPWNPHGSYRLNPPGAPGQYEVECYPGSKTTSLFGMNDNGASVGSYVSAMNVEHGYVHVQGRWIAVPGATRLLGVNNNGVAVGVRVDGSGRSHPVRYNIAEGRLSPIPIPGRFWGVVASGINDNGDVAGIVLLTAGSATSGFLLKNGDIRLFSFGNHVETEVFGINNNDVLVGSFLTGRYGQGTVVTHGFIAAGRTGLMVRVDGPAAVETVITGVNDKNTFVGYYTDSIGWTHGVLGRLW